MMPYSLFSSNDFVPCFGFGIDLGAPPDPELDGAFKSSLNSKRGKLRSLLSWTGFKAIKFTLSILGC